MNERSGAPGIGNFKTLLFYGVADGTNLNADFNIGEIQNRELTIKRVAFFPYANGVSIDEYVLQGANVYAGTIPDQSRLVKPLDYYGGGLRPAIRINQTLLSIFPYSIGAFGYPLDLDVDNINYKHSEKIVSINIAVTALYYNQVTPVVTTANPLLKLLLEVKLS